MKIEPHHKRNRKYQPFIKWVGGKRSLLSQIVPKFGNDFNTYFEPFIGGGAIFFELYSQGKFRNRKVYLSDINSELINSYKVVKERPEDLISELNRFKIEHSKEFYYEVRSWDREDSFQNRSSLERASRFIYLNKTCFNGLYRVNRKGYFNTPIGSYKNPNISDSETILNASEALQIAEIERLEFQQSLSRVEKNDLIYLDPPYYPLNSTSNFTSYSEIEFMEEMQLKLYNEFSRLLDINSKPFQSNSSSDFILELYKDFKVDKISANRFINSKASGRGKIDEVLISSRLID